MRIFLILTLALLTFIQTLAQQGHEQWEKAIVQLEKNKSEGAILFTGSSSIAKWQDVGNYFPGLPILNRGFGGSQFSDLLFYVDRVVIAAKPSRVFIYEGDNDLAAGVKPEEIVKLAAEVRQRIATALPDVPVIFISVKPSLARWNLKADYEKVNALLKEYTAKTPNTEFADVWTPMLDENGNVLKNIFVEDGLHMNAEGYAIWKKALEKYVTQ